MYIFSKMFYISLKCLILCKILTYINCSPSSYKSYEGYKHFDVSGDKAEIIKFLTDLENYDSQIITEGTKNGLEVLVSPKTLIHFQEKIENLNLRAKLVHNDISQELLKETRGSLLKKGHYSFDAFYDIDGINSFLRNISETYEDASLVVGGKSYQGRKILGLRIVTPKENAHDKPAVFIEGGIHPREWISPATITYFINELVSSDNANMTMLRNKFDWHIFPVFNPDGYHYTFKADRYWRKTRSRSSLLCYGADANRNWNHNWGNYSSSHNPCHYSLYAGKCPFSEIETKTLSEYLMKIENLSIYLAYHSNAHMLLVPYSDSKSHIDNYDDLVKIGKTSLDYGYEVNHARYDGPGTAAEILYPASGGSMDWVRQVLGTPLVFTYELRGNSFVVPPEQITLQGEEVTQMILGLVHEATQLGYF